MEHEPGRPDESESPSPLSDDEWARVAAYLAGEGEDAERGATEAWLASAPEHERLVQELSAAWVNTAVLPQVDVASARARVAQRVAPPARVRRRGFSLGWIGSLSAIVILVISVTRFWMGPDPDDSTHVVHASHYATARGEQRTFDMPDGSRVILAPESKLWYTQSRAGARTVTLQGQAYFTVTHDPEHLFTVRTAHVMTRVLGTAFSVRAYDTDTATQVAVAEGKVGIGEQVQGIVLLPGDVGYARNTQHVRVAQNERIVDVFGWMRWQRTFTGVPLRDVIVELERAYGIEVRVADAVLAARRFTGTVSGESGTSALEAIAFAVGAVPRWKGEVLVLSLQ